MKLRITVEGRIYDVDVEIVDEPADASRGAPAPRPAASSSVRPPAPAQSQAPALVTAHDATRCVSPLPGTVLKVLVQVGDQVRRNQTLVVLDAMKMETNVPSPVDGRVKAVHIAVGANVKQGDLMVEFD